MPGSPTVARYAHALTDVRKVRLYRPGPSSVSVVPAVARTRSEEYPTTAYFSSEAPQFTARLNGPLVSPPPWFFVST